MEEEDYKKSESKQERKLLYSKSLKIAGRHNGAK